MGHALQTLQLVDTKRARPFVPSELRIVSVLPGKTLGGVYLASYGPGSVLEYNELIVVDALTRHAGRSGFWISHIYVDNADSVAGGREIWGLPKDLAQFTWERGEQRQVLVRHEDRLLCILRYGHEGSLWRQRLMMPSFSIREPDLLFSKGAINARLGVARGRLEVPAESPFAALGLGRAWMTYHYKDMAFVPGIPQTMG
jgi:acetoacetate decarboxylase